MNNQSLINVWESFHINLVNPFTFITLIPYNFPVFSYFASIAVLTAFEEFTHR